MKRWPSCTLSGLTLMLALASAWLMSTGARAQPPGQAYTLQGEGMPAAVLQRLALERPPALPVLLLFSGRPGPGEDADFRRLLEGLRRDWLRLAGAALDQARTVWDSGHYIQKERPDSVAAAVQAVAAQAGGSTAGMPAPDTAHRHPAHRPH